MNRPYRRRFPAICVELAAAAGSLPDAADARDRRGGLEGENIRLRADNRDLRERLDVAAAVIQRLSLDKQALHDELYAARNIAVITPRR